MPRFYCPQPLQSDQTLALPASAARHVQVLRMQPGALITLFNGQGGEYSATIQAMGRSDVTVVLGVHDPVERESATQLHIALGMPANERMDWLVEKATELGVASIQPLVTERTVLRLSGERASKKQAHWQSIASAACEQSGRNRVPTVYPVMTLAAWLQSALPQAKRLLLGFSEPCQSLAKALAQGGSTPHLVLSVLSGPEGGLSRDEEKAALAAGFTTTTLGPAVLRAETAPLVVLSALSVLGQK
jgi:16S rRNA (uracil1498-N3)-methyltransferase